MSVPRHRTPPDLSASIQCDEGLKNTLLTKTWEKASTYKFPLRYFLYFHTIPPSIQYGCYNRERAYWSFLSLFYTLKYAIFEEPLGDLGSPQTPRPNFVLPLQVRYSYSPESDYVAVFLCYVQLANGRGHNKNKKIC